MRILHILDHSAPLHSGYTFRTLAILGQQRRMGWQTLHLTSAKQGAAAAEQDIDGWHFFRTPQNPRWWARLPVLRQLTIVSGLTRRLRQIAKAAHPNVLHAHSPVLNALAALRVGRALRIPVVYEIRAFWEDAAAHHGTSPHGGLRYRLSRALETYALRRVDAITTICEGLREDIVARGIPEQRITVIPNAVDNERFHAVISPPNPLLARRLALNGGPVIGFIGSFYAYEGLALLVQTMPQMLAACPSLKLLLVGGGPQGPALRAQVEQLGLQNSVRFAGRVAHEQVGELYGLIDILVYPRLPMRLTHLVTPLKPLEAMAQGRLIIASDVGGHREMITHGQTGMLFEAGNAAALAAQIAHLLRHRELWPALRKRARAYVERERNWPASVARYRDVYQRLLAPAP
ncbi:glycosyltransferase, exosortase A system-associated [Duganella sp. sic0402]|uniref:TIGR04063 family PEP-CTERM/XrtA system glycosyltransferase n=1 Tax=Duganella sp. sic0402 TaxID=2854786 RepID=UPI001C45DC6F|nr:TIGR04063 family PEP-CTERM/XrtA system glycosyltransferase [Duganella sp. sic0402]MBV7534763.1 glycosyltransferase, exosortase A system-associated [Duganella sp. sic0402]